MDGQHGGIFFSTDEGKTWKPFNRGLRLDQLRIRQILSGEDGTFLATNQGIYTGFPEKRDWSLIQTTVSVPVNDLAFANQKQDKLLLATDDGIQTLDLRTGRLRKKTIPVYDRAIFSVFTDNSFSYIGTEMGVFRSEDSGNSWTIKVDGLPYASVKKLYKLRDRLFCATNLGVFYSDNHAETWQKADGIFPIEIASIAGGPINGQVFAADSTVGYLFESRDNGASWNPIDLGPEISRVSALHLTLSGQLLAGTVAEGVVLIIPKGAKGSEDQKGTH
jgi:ligand-binding sensor domain-containing protein